MFSWLSTVVIQRISATLDADSVIIYDCFCTAVIRIGIVLTKTHYVALRTFDPLPETPTGF